MKQKRTSPNAGKYTFGKPLKRTSVSIPIGTEKEFMRVFHEWRNKYRTKK